MSRLKKSNQNRDQYIDYQSCIWSLFFTVSLYFFIELSALIDKIDSMRTIADIFAFVQGDKLTGKKGNVYE